MSINQKKLSLTWYIDPPLDFEYKQYILLSYLQDVDHSFIKKELSPHLLYLEKVVSEMNRFKESFDDMIKIFDKHRYHYFQENFKLIGENNEMIQEIFEVIEFSIPQVETRISLGNSILKKTRQILY